VICEILLITDVPLRGDDFRLAFAQIGDLRSIIPNSVHVLALTGTATPNVFDSVVKRLSLKDTAVIGLSPNRDNIKYHVEPLISVNHLCDMFAESIRTVRTEFPKTLVFCQTIAECSLMYRTLRKLLGEEFTDPPGFPDFHKHRLVDMYTRASSDDMKKKILVSFMTEGGKLRLLIATSAFSMGVDCPDIQNVVHLGPPSSLVQYVQESGRVGRNGAFSVALLLYGTPGKHLQTAMKAYCTNTTDCRRNVLFKDFMFYNVSEFLDEKCKCCDICSITCTCIECQRNN